MVPSLDLDLTKMSMSAVMVPTVETASIQYWMKAILPHRGAAMLVGPAGVGKTAIVNGFGRGLQGDTYMVENINVSDLASPPVDHHP